MSGIIKRCFIALLALTFALWFGRAAQATPELEEISGFQGSDADQLDTVKNPAPALTVTIGKQHLLQGHIVQPAINAFELPTPAGLFGFVNQLKVTLPDTAPHGSLQKSVSAGKSVANYMLDLRGFDFSKEAANVALDEHLKPNSDSAKEYLRRAQLDSKELSLISSVMKLADALSSSSPRSLNEKDGAMKMIQTVFSEEQSINVYSRLSDLETDSAQPLRWTAPWDIADREDKSKQIFEAAASSDPVVQNLKERLHKYNSRGKAMQLTAKVAYSTLGIASFSPTLVAPVAETALLAFMMSTGGPEQDKLLKEIYLCKCLASRYNCIAEKTNLVTECYSRAVSTKNPVLLGCTRELLKEMTSDQIASAVFEQPTAGLCHSSSAAPQSLAMPDTVTQ